MSVQQNQVRGQTLAVPAGLNRLLLLCRFDFQQKNWGLPSCEIRGDFNGLLAAEPAALAAAILQTLSDFSDPSLGGASPAKTATRRIIRRHALRQPSGKTKPKNQQKNRVKLQPGFQTKGEATRVVDLLHRPRGNPATITQKHENTDQCQVRQSNHQSIRFSGWRDTFAVRQDFGASLPAAQNPRAVAAAGLGAQRGR